jgi:hypothetical protein
MNAAGAGSRLARFEFLGSPRFVTALSTVTVGVAASTYALQNIVGWPGLIAIVAVLVALAAASAFMRRHALDWQGILPISLIAFLAWCGLSVLWSEYQWATLSSLLYQFSFALLAVYIALTRDMIQIVRVFGNVLRALLGASIFFETISGIIIDTPLAFLGIHGKLADGGPIQGIAGDSARLGILALVAGITFAVELLTRSVQRVTSIVSLAGAVVIILLTHSNVVMLIGFAVVLAALVLTGVRHVRPEVRQPLSWSLLVAGVVAISIIVLLRGNILAALSSSDQVANRSSLWRLVQDLTVSNSLEGWGWIGHWRTELSPFFFFWQVRRSDYASAFNTFLDIWFQVGLVGLVIFCGLIGLALVRSWHLAVRQPSVVYLWPALVLVALICTGFTESALIVEFCWLTLVICVVKSANKLSWRTAFERLRPPLQPDLRER